MPDALFQMREVADVPTEMRPGLERQLERVRHLVPPWYHRIRVYYKPKPAEDEDECNAFIEISPEYRRAHINILPHWLDETEDDRHRTLVHEIAHLPTCQLNDLARTLVDKLVSDESTKQVLFEEIRLATEAATEDITQMILRTEAKA